MFNVPDCPAGAVEEVVGCAPATEVWVGWPDVVVVVASSPEPPQARVDSKAALARATAQNAVLWRKTEPIFIWHSRLL